MKQWRCAHQNNQKQPETRSVKAAGCGCFLMRPAIFYQVKCKATSGRHRGRICLEQAFFLCLITRFKIQEAKSSELWTNILAVQNRAPGLREEEEETKQEGWPGKARLEPFPPGFQPMCMYVYIYIYLYIYIYIYIFFFFFFFFFWEEMHSCLVLWKERDQIKSLWCYIWRVSQM